MFDFGRSSLPALFAQLRPRNVSFRCGERRGSRRGGDRRNRRRPRRQRPPARPPEYLVHVGDVGSCEADGSVIPSSKGACNTRRTASGQPASVVRRAARGGLAEKGPKGHEAVSDAALEGAEGDSEQFAGLLVAVFGEEGTKTATGFALKERFCESVQIH